MDSRWNWKGMSRMRRIYFVRLVTRILVFVAGLVLYFVHPAFFDVLNGWGFFRGFSLLHLLWLAWVGDMLAQLMPVKDKIALGSQKLFRGRFRPIREKVNREALRKYIRHTSQSALWVMLMWAALIAVIGVLYHKNVLDDAALFLITLCFYVCDLICVLIWCPFRLILKNRCCTTCRIFNWDHLMMFTPSMFIGGFYTRSLLMLSIVVWLVWESCILVYPERFWEQTNEALRCSNCTDKLCTQYCQKLRDKRAV